MPTMPIVFALLAASCASAAAAVAAVTASVVRSDSLWMREARSAFVGASTGGNVAPARSCTSSNVLGPDVRERSNSTPSSVPDSVNVYAPAWDGTNGA